MTSSAFDLGEDIDKRKVVYNLHPPMWGMYTNKVVAIDFAKWTKIKYLNTRGTALHADVETIPDTSGGLYLFFIKCPIIEGLTEFPLYIGRAQFSGTQNLKKRCKEYYQKYSHSDERPKITRMFKYWSKELYLAYKPLGANRSIVNIEKQLINSLLLPMNDAIPDQIIRQAIKAFK